MLGPPAPNRIHSLPVRVSYYIPSSSQTYTTTFATPQQVYIHPNAADSDSEIWGSIYLKTVLKGVLTSSPELHPSYPNTPDLSLYVLDPRETYFRRTRSSGSAFHPSPDTHGNEVWTGKGLVSWTLAEPGQGKNLIAGRLIRDDGFARASNVHTQGMSPLEALMAADAIDFDANTASWGIEISVGLNSGLKSSGGMARVQAQVQAQQGMDRRGSTASVHDMGHHHTQHSHGGCSHPHGYAYNTQHPSSSAPGPSTYTPHPSSSASGSAAKPKPKAAPKSAKPRAKSTRPPPSTSKAAAAAALIPGGLPLPLPGAPADLTRDQAQRLLASPAFLDMLGKIAGTPVDAPSSTPAMPGMPSSSAGSSYLPKRPREEEMFVDTDLPPLPKKKRGRPSKEMKAREEKAREEKAREQEAREEMERMQRKLTEELGILPEPSDVWHAPPQTPPRCYNCGRTKSAVWRTKTNDDGQVVRVCNACGLYWNKLGIMRPPNLWTADTDDAPVSRDRRSKTSTVGHSSRASSEHPTAPPSSGPVTRSADGFRRTLTNVVNSDAKRFALRHKGRGPESPPREHARAGPMTSPPRGSASAAISLRSAKYAGAASSPGGYAEAMGQYPSSEPVEGESRFQREATEKDDEEEEEQEEMRAPPTQRTLHHPGHAHPSHPHSHHHSHPHAQAAPRVTRAHPQSDVHDQSQDLPLSDDGAHPKPEASTQVDWNADISALFDVEGFMPTPDPDAQAENHAQLPSTSHTFPTRGHLGANSPRGRHHPTSSSAADFGDIADTDSTMEEDTVLSQLFNRTSSMAGPSSSPAFDFSQLPPSSPPMSVLSSDTLPHSALLLSSPAKKTPPSVTSPSGLTPLDGNRAIAGSSKLRHSVSADEQESSHSYSHGHAHGGHGHEHEGTTPGQSPLVDFDAIQRMFSMEVSSDRGTPNLHAHGGAGDVHSHLHGSHGQAQGHGHGATPEMAGFEDPAFGALHELIGTLNQSGAVDHAEEGQRRGGQEKVHGQRQGQGQKGVGLGMGPGLTPPGTGSGGTSSASAALEVAGDGEGDIFASFLEGGAFH
ncbi:hypothetical protein IAT38_003894 [Cryptococcus sp. DSM 104549]